MDSHLNSALEALARSACETVCGGGDGRREVMVLYVSASMVQVHRQNILSTSVTLLVSRINALPTLWLVLSVCPFVSRQLPENRSLITPRHDLCVTNVSVPCGEEKRVCQQPRPWYKHINDTDCRRPTGVAVSTPCYIILRTSLHEYQSHDTYKDGSGAECCPL